MLTVEKKVKLKINGKENGFSIRSFIDDRIYSLSLGNKKLPFSTMIFNIPAVKTCPFATEFCKTKCYALKAERIYKNTKEARERNFQNTKNESFAEDLINTIAEASRIFKIEAFRIHESGDFYHKEYLKSWYKIAEAFPSIQFYAYTKSFFFDFEGKPKNLILIASFDHSTTKTQKEFYLKNESFFDKTFSIVEKNKSASCIQNCSLCNLCFTNTGKKENITVNLH